MEKIEIKYIINNIPDYMDYHKKGDEVFFKTFLDLCSLINYLEGGNEDDDPPNTGYVILNRKYSIDELISNLHLSCELYLKSLICKIDPIKLININIEKNNVEYNFDDFNTIDASFLYSTMIKLNGKDSFINELNEKNFSSDIYEKLRKKRNKYMHTQLMTPLKIESVKELIVDALTIYYFFNKNCFKEKLYKFLFKTYFKNKKNIYKIKKVNLKTHLSGETSYDISEDYYSIFRTHYSLIINTVFRVTNKKIWNIVLRLPKYYEKRYFRYLCPNCVYYARSSIINTGSITESECPGSSYSKDIFTHNDNQYHSFIPILKDSATCICFVCGYKEKKLLKICFCCNDSEGVENKKFMGTNEHCITCGCSKYDIDRYFQ